jgi:hypothetical protein
VSGMVLEPAISALEWPFILKNLLKEFIKMLLLFLIFFFFFIFLGWSDTPLGTSANNWPIVPHPDDI